jgi:hypothetical protein
MKHATPSFLKKLADFKKESLEILKNKEAYGYNYAPLDTVLPVVEPNLRKHGLWYYHSTNFNKSGNGYLETVIYEVEGEKVEIGTGTLTGGYISSKTLIDPDVKLAKMNPFMVMGSALTYFRRYHLVTMLGLLTDEDSGAGDVKGRGNSVETAQVEMNYLKTFSGLVENNKPIKQIKTLYKNYVHLFSETQKTAIDILISDYENK